MPQEMPVIILKQTFTMKLTLLFAVRKWWYQHVSVFKGADWLCCWYW